MYIYWKWEMTFKIRCGGNLFFGSVVGFADDFGLGCDLGFVCVWSLFVIWVCVCVWSLFLFLFLFSFMLLWSGFRLCLISIGDLGLCLCLISVSFSSFFHLCCCDLGLCLCLISISFFLFFFVCVIGYWVWVLRSGFDWEECEEPVVSLMKINNGDRKSVV